MDYEKRVRGSQIPEFGNWDYVNELPITQYFECARDAGLIRHSLSGECGHAYNYHGRNRVDYDKFQTNSSTKQVKSRVKKSSGGGQVSEEGKNKQVSGKVFDVTVTELPHHHHAHGAKRAVNAVNRKHHQCQYDAVLSRAPKAVDEDLYKIPPELLKRKRRLGFFSRCLVPPCAV